MKERRNSKQLFELSQKYIPGGVNSPVRSFQSFGIPPIVIEKGDKDQLFDIDGNSYIDFCCSWGSLILGHSPQNIMRKLEKQLHLGTSFGALTKIEAIYAKELIEVLGFVDKIRFVSSGTEATMSALRLARGYTGKNKIIKFSGNYHGHVDALLVKAGSGVGSLNQSSSLGIPKETTANVFSLTYNDIEEVVSVMDQNEDIAAVILEPIAGNMGVVPASFEFMKALREETKKRKIVLIMDEVITGFRLGLQGACGYFGITPDLVCYGKVIGGGFPVAAFGGRKDIMNLLAPIGGVYQAGTLSGNPIAMNAGYETLQVIKQKDFYENLEKKLSFLLDPIEEFIKHHHFNIALQRVKTMFSFFFEIQKVENDKDLAMIDSALFKQFFLNLFEKGIYLSPSPHEASFISQAHTTQHLAFSRDAIIEELSAIFFKQAASV